MNVNNEINDDLNNKYRNGKIYIIYSLNSSKVYFGSTTYKIDRRLQLHISYYNGYKKGKYKYCNSTCDMFDDLDVNNCKIKLIKNYPCNSRKALELEEGKFIVSSKNCYNKNVAGRTKHEYANDNADKLKQKINCECGGKHTYANISIHLKSIKHQKYLKIDL